MNIIMIGFGVVGQNVAETLASRSLELRKEYGVDPKVIAMVDRGGTVISKDGADPFKVLQAKRSRGLVSLLNSAGRPGYSALEALEEVDGDIVIEVTPTDLETGEPDLTYIQAAGTKCLH